MTQHQEGLWPVEVVWDRTASSRAASPALAEVPGWPQFPRLMRSCQWLSDRPNKFLGTLGEVTSFTYAAGWVWLRTMSIGYWRKVQIAKAIVILLDEFHYWDLRSPRPPLSPTFTALHLHSPTTELIFLSPILLHLPPGNKKWPVSLHLLKSTGCKSTGYRCKWGSLKKPLLSWGLFVLKNQWIIKQVEANTCPPNTGI